MADTLWSVDFWPAGFWADGFWTNQGAPEPAPEPTGQTPAGSSRRRRQYVVEVDGQDFLVSSVDEALALLQRARAIAEQQVERKARGVEKRLRKREVVPVVALPPPVITVPSELRAELASVVADIERLYAKASMEMELRLLLLKQQQDEDDDEDVILLS